MITHPTHDAVALLFDFGDMAKPHVLCKGRDLHAAEIREQARWAGMPIVENRPLARSLYRGVEEGQAIPYELYAAVAAVLAFLFRESAERTKRETHSVTTIVVTATPRLHASCCRSWTTNRLKRRSGNPHE